MRVAHVCVEGDNEGKRLRKTVLLGEAELRRVVRGRSIGITKNRFFCELNTEWRTNPSDSFHRSEGPTRAKDRTAP